MRMKSKIDAVTYIIFLSTIALVVVPLFAVPTPIVAHVVIWPPLLFMIDILFTTDYAIVGDMLIVRCGHLIKWRVPIMKITTVCATHTLLSAPALSVDRLALKYGRFDEIVISPRDKVQFVEKLQQVNDKIVWC